MAKVITSQHTFRAFHPPQKACISFAFSFALHHIFKLPRNRFLGTAALSYQLERKVTRVLVLMYGIACHCESLTTLHCSNARRKGHLVVHTDVCSSICVLGGWPQVERRFFKYLPKVYTMGMINALRFLAQVTFAERWLLLSGDKLNTRGSHQLWLHIEQTTAAAAHDWSMLFVTRSCTRLDLYGSKHVSGVLKLKCLIVKQAGESC